MDRRRFLKAAAQAAAVLALPRKAPARITAEGARPRTREGVQSGDVTPEGAVIWSRTDRPSRMQVEWALDPQFQTPLPAPPIEVLEQTDFTGKVALRGLPAGRDIHYRVVFESLRDGALSAPLEGRLRTPDARGDRPVRFAWSGDTCGQGYGINPDFGGYKLYEAVRREEPDFFVHSGDLIYADQPLKPSKGVGGQTWKNRVTPAKSKVAETLEEFRGCFRYNLLDEHMRRLCAEVPWVVQWDDHETKNNWWPGRQLTEDNRYKQEKSCSLLAARGRRAMLEYTPLATRLEAPDRIYRALPYGPLLETFVLDARSYRGPNGPNRETVYTPESHFFGPEQVAWLCQRLEASQATWKLIANDMPLSLMIGHAQHHFEGMANGGGPPLGRELELVRILEFIRKRRIRNVVWITADVHYAAAHHYRPDRAVFGEFDPFWEFVAGPINAATFGPNRIDPTFGPEVVFCSEEKGQKPGRSPLEGHQFYGLGVVDPNSKALTVSLHNLDGRRLWGTTLDARA